MNDLESGQMHHNTGRSGRYLERRNQQVPPKRRKSPNKLQIAITRKNKLFLYTRNSNPLYITAFQ